jgi:hypothetical protein
VNQEVLRQAITEGLMALGEPIMKTITWHLRAHGIFLDSNSDLEVRILYNHLQQIVGNIADVVMDEIYESLNAKGLHSPSQIKSSEPVVNRIEQMLKVGGAET